MACASLSYGVLFYSTFLILQSVQGRNEGSTAYVEVNTRCIESESKSKLSPVVSMDAQSLPSPSPLSSDSCRIDEIRKYVNCTSRHLNSIPSDLPADAEVLYIGRNVIRQLWNNSFAHLPELREIFIDYNGLAVIESSAFGKLENLQTVDLSGNTLSSLPWPLLGAESTLQELNLRNNRFDSVESLGPVLYLTNLRELSLGGNRIRLLQPAGFAAMAALESLSLELNQILALEPLSSDTKWNTPRLRALNLAGNRLDYIPSKAFLGLDSLESLKLLGNPIMYLASDALYGLDQLLTLDVSETHIGSFKHDLNLQFVPNLRKLWIRNARLKQAYPVDGLANVHQLEEIDLSGNDITSLDLWNDFFQVSLFSEKQYLREIVLDGNARIGDIPAGTFRHLTALSILSLKNCGMKTIDGALFHDLGNLTSLSLDMNVISDLHPHTFATLRSLKVLSAGGNSLTTIHSVAFSNTTLLQYLSLPNNAITLLRGETFQQLPRLEALDIRGNPIVCTCDLQSFSDWLKVRNASLLVGEDNRTVCSTGSIGDAVGISIVEFAPAEYCQPKVALFVCLGISFVLVVISAAMSYHYRYWLRYKLFLLKLCVVGYRVYDVRDADEYDFYLNVVYVADDEGWVNDFLRPFVREHFPDKNEHTDMVFGDDDLIPGMYYLEAVDYAVVNSYKTIVLLSNAAIREDWFTTKFRIALQHMHETHLEKIIILFIEEINENELPFIVRVFLSRNRSYLAWPDDDRGRERFSEQLLKALEANVRCNITIPT